jgi:hypothetical protein
MERSTFSNLEVVETLSSHSDFVDAYAYMIAGLEAKLRGEYLLLYVKKRPTWFPDFLYRWILSKVLVLTVFKRSTIR